MTGVFRVNRWRMRLFVIAGAILLAAGPAAAQSEAPSAPNDEKPAPGAPSGPVRLMPLGDPDTPPPLRPQDTPPLAERPRTPSSIEVEGLQAVDPDSVGTLGPENGGFGADMWSGTSRQFIKTLLSRIPARIESPTLRDLARRLLLSTARVPLAEKRLTSRTSLLAQRIERLRAIGLVDDARSLLAAAPSRLRAAVLLRLSIRQMIIDGNYPGACAEAMRDARRRADADWQRLVIFCQLQDGKTEAALFGANILAEMPGFDDPTFLALVDRLGGADGVKITSIQRPTPLHLAMFEQAKLPLPDDVAKTDSPVVLQLVALRDDVGEAVRLRAAERAAVRGALTPAKLGEIYAGMRFSDADIDRALSIAENERSPRARALLYRAAGIQKVATAKAAVLRMAFDAAREAGLMPLAARLYRPILDAMPATGELAWFAGDATRALLAAGAVDAARPWLLLVRQRALRDDAARDVRDALWVYAVLAREAGPAANETSAMEAWFDRLKEGGPDTAAAKAGLALAMMYAVGIYPPEGFEGRILALPPGKIRAAGAPPGVLQALANAGARRRLGETVSLALIAFDGRTLAEVDAQLLGEVVQGLVSVGLAAEAQALTLEAAMAAGL